VKADVVEKLGSESHLIFAVDAPRISAEAVRAAHDAEEVDDGVLLADDARSQFTARVDGRFRVRAGGRGDAGARRDGAARLRLRVGVALGGGAAAQPAMVVA